MYTQCAILTCVSLAFLACSYREEPVDVSLASRALSDDDGGDGHCRGEGGDEGDDDECFLASRVAQGFALAPVPLATEGKTRQQLDRIGYGSYIVNGLAVCNLCHSSNDGWIVSGPHLAGGRRIGPPSAAVYARNLTPDPATGLQLTEAQFIEVMETGKDFRLGATQQLSTVMPWPVFRWMSRGDLKAIYAYLRAIPPVVNLTPPDTAVGRPPPVPFSGTYDAGDVVRPLPSDSDRIQPNMARGLAVSPLAQPRDLDDERQRYGRGSYLVNAISGCTGCHTNPDQNRITLRLSTTTFLSGGHVYPSPPAAQPVLRESRAFSANLTGLNHGFFHEPDSTFDRFQRVIRTGTHADETPPRPLAFPMPWAIYRNMVDEDLHSMFVYLTLLPPRTGGADKEIQDSTRWCATAADCHSDETCYANPATGANECVGGACANDQDCSTCQTCTAGACRAPGFGDLCLTAGI